MYRYCPKCGSLFDRSGGEEALLTCAASGCGFIHYDNPVPVVAAIVERDGHVLLVRAKNMPAKFFGLVTGFLEKREDPAAAVLRELKEETNLDGAMQRLVGVYPFSPMNQVIIAYHLHAQGEIQLGDELAEYKLIPVERVKPWPFDGEPLGTGLALRDFLGSRSTH